MKKIALSCDDDRRYIKDDRISAYAFGHKDISTSCDHKKVLFSRYKRRILAHFNLRSL